MANLDNIGININSILGAINKLLEDIAIIKIDMKSIIEEMNVIKIYNKNLEETIKSRYSKNNKFDKRLKEKQIIEEPFSFKNKPIAPGSFDAKMRDEILPIILAEEENEVTKKQKLKIKCEEEEEKDNKHETDQDDE